jgi:hypothetical protein
MMADVGLTDAVLTGLVDRDSRLSFTLVFAEPSELVDGAAGREIDDVLLDAQRRGLIVGERGEGDGSAAWWSTVRLTVVGLRALGQWPPAGREWVPGLWDDGVWGARAKPLLARLRDTPPAHGFYLREGIGDLDPEPSREWAALLLLIEAGLVSGRVTSEGVDTLRTTHEGDQALDPTPRDPLDAAEAELRSGAPVDAIVTAVELGLAPKLKALASAKGIAITNATGQSLKLSFINNTLPGAGAYRESDRAQVEAWLKLRNDVAHPDGAEAVSAARVASVIAGIRVFLDEHPT